MSLSYQQMIEQALSQAMAGLDPLTAPVLDEAWMGEDFVSSIFQQVGVKCARDEHKRSLLRKSKTVVFANGVATLADDVLTEYKEDSALYDPTDFTKEYSLIREWNDFVQPRAGYALWLGSYSLNGVTISAVEPNANYDPSAGISASRTLVIPCVPVIPASASDPVVVIAEIENELVEGLAIALRGAIQQKTAA